MNSMKEKVCLANIKTGEVIRVNKYPDLENPEQLHSLMYISFDKMGFNSGPWYYTEKKIYKMYVEHLKNPKTNPAPVFVGTETVVVDDKMQSQETIINVSGFYLSHNRKARREHLQRGRSNKANPSDSLRHYYQLVYKNGKLLKTIKHYL